VLTAPLPAVAKACAAAKSVNVPAAAANSQKERLIRVKPPCLDHDDVKARSSNGLMSMSRKTVKKNRFLKQFCLLES
jgi:hypothetical protein